MRSLLADRGGGRGSRVAEAHGKAVHCTSTWREVPYPIEGTLRSTVISTTQTCDAIIAYPKLVPKVSTCLSIVAIWNDYALAYVMWEESWVKSV
jgi:hypothetical protein